ncbi:hypothetical protein Taro_020386 [Colocasia esculenta]|uniref:Uncharacterized protein n=1 Tax=Colocasia esculenta TaxID=4460 RepID=A0A843UYN7_COLES|nr:hypothetical protein [Colocasia esculenta]
MFFGEEVLQTLELRSLDGIRRSVSTHRQTVSTPLASTVLTASWDSHLVSTHRQLEAPFFHLSTHHLHLLLSPLLPAVDRSSWGDRGVRDGFGSGEETHGMYVIFVKNCDLGRVSLMPGFEGTLHDPSIGSLFSGFSLMFCDEGKCFPSLDLGIMGWIALGSSLGPYQLLEAEELNIKGC